MKSSLGEEEILFPSYNAIQIQDILRKRCELAFKESVVQPGVIEKCSAFAAREHGDARRAIDLLRVAGEIAERKGSEKIELDHLDEAEHKVEADKVINSVINQPGQFQYVLYSILNIAPEKNSFYTGEIYAVYREVCKKSNLNVLTQRRISDILAELDMLGIINAKIISKGRYGRTREISLSIDEVISNRLKEILTKHLQLENE